MSDEEHTKPKYNTLKLLSYFQNKFFQTYNIAFQYNAGRDIKLMKKVKTLFEQNLQLGDVVVFIDLCFKDNPKNQIGTSYLLAVVNRKLGLRKKTTTQTKSKPPVEDTTEADWAEANKMWNDRLI